MPSKAETFSVRLPNDVKHQVDELARLTKRSRSFIIKEAVDSYMNNCAIHAQELEEALKSAESGIGHSSEQIFAWMKSWGAENELPSPDPDILPLN
jgi:predicted transcriptional regulator